MADDDTTADDATTDDATDDARTGDSATGTDWEAEAKKWEKRAKENGAQAKAGTAALKKLKELEDADKTELQKLTDRVTLAEKRADDAELQVLRAEVAGNKGLTVAQAKRLVGSSREELETDADDLLATFGANKKAAAADTDTAPGTDTGKPRPRPGGRPVEKLRDVATPEGNEAPDAKKIAADILKNPF